MKLIMRARVLRAAALTVGLLAVVAPAAAKDIVGFIDQEMAKADKRHFLILHNKQGWTRNIIDTIKARLEAKSFPYAYQTYNDGDGPKDIARPFDFTKYSAVFCFGQIECEFVRAQALEKGFEGDYFDANLEKR